MGPNWADITAAIASTLGVFIGLGLPALRAWRRHRAQLSLDAHRLNGGMCEVEFRFLPTRATGELQLEVKALWPKSLFLIPSDGAVISKPDGSRTISGDWITMRHVTIRMGKRAGLHVASAHVWSKVPFQSAWLRVRVIDRSSRGKWISRWTRINPLP